MDVFNCIEDCLVAEASPVVGLVFLRGLLFFDVPGGTDLSFSLRLLIRVKVTEGIGLLACGFLLDCFRRGFLASFLCFRRISKAIEVAKVILLFLCFIGCH